MSRIHEAKIDGTNLYSDNLLVSDRASEFVSKVARVKKHTLPTPDANTQTHISRNNFRIR